MVMVMVMMMMMMMMWNEPAQAAQVPMLLKYPFVYHVFSSYEEGGPTGAGKTRFLAVILHNNGHSI